MVDYWNDRPVHATRARVPVILVNDLDQPWQGTVTLRVRHDGRTLFETKQDCRLEPLGQANAVFDIAWPEQVGQCVLEAELRGTDAEPVRSVRDIEIVEHPATGLAFQKPVTASSTHSVAYKPENAVDGDPNTYWSSEFKDGAWLAVDLGAAKKISRVQIQWEAAFTKSFSVQVSADGKSWTDVYKTNEGKGGISKIKFAAIEARHVRILCTKRGTRWGNAVCELEVFER